MSGTCLLFVLELLVIFALGDDSDDCVYKECYCGDGYIICSNRDLKTMPQRLYMNKAPIISMEMDGNQIPTIPAGSLPANITTLHWQNNPIEKIDDAAFDESIHTLQELTFSQARFTQIPEAVFHLKALNSFSISDTGILVWDDVDMQQLGPTMNILVLDTVGLTTWPTWIKSMTNLTQLTISGSSIATIPDDALDLVADILTELHLSNNNLSTLPQTLAKLTTLKKLSLDYNKITDVTWLPMLSHLQTLSLNNNKITDAQGLSSALKPHAESLFRLDIQENRLISIPELSFLSQIYTLNLTSNRISDANSGSVPITLIELKLELNALPFIPRIMKTLNTTFILYLDSNNIRSIQGSDIPPQINEVHLGSNLISHLSSSSFRENSKINFLYLNNNPLYTISPEVFTNLRLLNELDLRQTQLTRLPLGIASLTSLDTLDVSGNPNLVCTCQEQGLQERIQAIGSEYAKGDCGVVSVYQFFEKLSPNCPQIS